MAPRPVRSTRRSEMFLLLAVVLWSTTFALMKESLGSISPALLVLIRFAIAAAVVYVFFRSRIEFTWINLLKGLAIGIPEYVGFILQVTGLTMTTASKNAFITGLSIVVAPVLSFLFLGEQRSWKVALALLLAVTVSGSSPSGSRCASAAWTWGTSSRCCAPWPSACRCS